MAIWRTKAYVLFDLHPGAYSYANGKKDLFADLVEWARLALQDDDSLRLNGIIEYVVWAAKQTSNQLSSTVELSFFLPVFRDEVLCSQLKPYIPEDLFAEKWHLLMEKRD